MLNSLAAAFANFVAEWCSAMLVSCQAIAINIHPPRELNGGKAGFLNAEYPQSFSDLPINFRNGVLSGHVAQMLHPGKFFKIKIDKITFICKNVFKWHLPVT